MRTTRAIMYAIVAVSVLAGIVVIVLAVLRPSVTESEVRTVVVDTFLREQPESFLITGTITFTTSVISESSKRLLPGVLNLDLGTTVATVRAPGRAAYGFDASVLSGEDIRLSGDTVFVRLPALEVFAVEPDLEQLEEQVDVGWARMYRSSGQAQSLAALRQLQPAMRQRAREFLATSDYPHENTRRAVERMLGPALRATGIVDPVIVIDVRPTIVTPLG
ncbi:MAG: DUF4230 domain-containing protein [Rhodothermales bacterium]|nr:DUF4230 domain-containing protein [Rhodothermales bacterium]